MISKRNKHLCSPSLPLYSRYKVQNFSLLLEWEFYTVTVFHSKLRIANPNSEWWFTKLKSVILFGITGKICLTASIRKKQQTTNIWRHNYEERYIVIPLRISLVITCFNDHHNGIYQWSILVYMFAIWFMMYFWWHELILIFKIHSGTYLEKHALYIN